jgi:hypothetical protein
MSQKWYQGSKGKVKVSWVALPIPGSKVKVGGNITNWYQSLVSTLSLDGPC